MTRAQFEIRKEDVLAAESESKDIEYKVGAIEVLVQLAERKSLIAKITGIGVLAGLILSFALPVRYTATTEIMPPQQTQSTSNLLMSQLTAMGGGALSAMTGSGISLKNPNDIYIGLLNSRAVADYIVQKYDLMNVYRARTMTDARKKLANYTDIASAKSGLIVVSVTDRDKQRAAAMANDYTQDLRNLTKTLAVTEASQRRLFYEEQLKQSKDALVAAALAFQQIQQKKGLVQLDAQAKAMIAGLSSLRAQVAAKEVELQALRSYSTESNPEVQLAEQQLASLHDQELRMEKSGHASDISSLGLQSVPGAGLEYLRAEHELQYRQTLYDMLMKQYDAARIDESKDSTVIQVVSPAIEPDKRSSPKRAMIIALSMVSGFLLACILALFQWWRQLVKFDPDTEKQIQSLKRAFGGRKTKSA